MIWILILFFGVRVIFHPNPFWQVHFLFAQDFCIDWTIEQKLSPLFAGLICGKSLSSTEQSLFLNLGIYHWLVASGGHLVFIQQILDWVSLKKNRYRFGLLFIYSLICGFQPPILRAFASMTLALISKQQGLFLTRQQRNLNAGLFCLCVFPDWMQSLSFQLSWLASIALDPKKSIAFQAFSISVFLYPLSQSWSLLHLVYNIALTPLFSFFLFPMTLFFFLFAPIFPYGNIFWETVCSFLQFLPKDNIGNFYFSSHLEIWIYIFTLQTVLLVFERIKK